ncbi:MAG: hypothetical protein HYS12_06830 [Planctomycetes bacterium]|nr:hypothetical protein [Planctomycetota bacterium]
MHLAEGKLFIQADEMQLQQVLINLCLNARDAMPQGGRLEIKTRREERRTSNVERRTSNQESSTFDVQSSTFDVPKGWLCLSIEDNGQGMTEEVRCRIFEPFFSTRERGTGLGLAIVHQIITSFGGHIEVQSEPGRGTCFDVWLPLSEEQE